MNMNIENIRINMKIVNNSDASEKAIFTLTIGPIKSKGFRIMPSKFPNKRGELLWIVVPAYRSRTGKFHKMFFCEDKNLWQEIEEKIWEEYYKAEMKNELKEDEIPIVEEEKP